MPDSVRHDDGCASWYSDICNCTASEPPHARQSIPIDFLHNEDWAKFGLEWPRAAAFLRARNLSRELQYMETTGKASGLNASYVAHRIAELRGLGIVTVEEVELANAGYSSLPGAAEDERTSMAAHRKTCVCCMHGGHEVPLGKGESCDCPCHGGAA